MPIELDHRCRERLTDALAEALNLVKVASGRFLFRGDTWETFATLDAILPRQPKLQEQLIKYLDDNPFAEFAISELTDELSDCPILLGAADTNEIVNTQLSEIAGFEDHSATAKRLVEKFCALPRTYTLTFELPDSISSLLGPNEGAVEFSNKLRIVRATPSFQERFSAGEERVGLLEILQPARWRMNGIYLQIETTGYVDPYASTNTYADAVRTIRSFCGLGLALRLFDYRSTYSSTRPSFASYVHGHEPNGSPIFIRKLDVEEGLAATLNNLKPLTLKNEAHRQTWNRRIFDELKAIFGAPFRLSDPITLAAQWYFDSESAKDDQLKFVQLMVVMEIILGEKAASDKIGLNELLANRCAYLIGTSNAERKTVYESFKRIYDVRSQIVHRGKHRLSLEERRLTYQLKFFCRKVIQKEVDLVIADAKRELAGPH